jgi:LPXTG-site transpeptidase (sortase) family protein
VRPVASTAAPRPPAAAPAATTTTTTTTAAVATTTTVATTAAPPPVIETHDATFGALPAPTAAVPVGVEAGEDIAGPVVSTGVDTASGELALPAEAKVVVWYQYGPAPGEAGSAVLAGHVDWHGVPGVFFRLRELEAGDAVEVAMSDGSARRFRVVDVRLVDKPELPRAEVFARTGEPTLTLVTCGGEFDSSTHHYRSNVVVTALPG